MTHLPRRSVAATGGVGETRDCGERDRAAAQRTHSPEPRPKGAERPARPDRRASGARPAARPDRRTAAARDSVECPGHRPRRRQTDPPLQEPAYYACNWGSARPMPSGRAAETPKSGVSR